jgi:hypothetical protein
MYDIPAVFAMPMYAILKLCAYVPRQQYMATELLSFRFSKNITT